jgi:hypothetical protein
MVCHSRQLADVQPTARRTFGQGFPFDENLATNDGTRRELLEEDGTARLPRWKRFAATRECGSIEPTPRTA